MSANSPSRKEIAALQMRLREAEDTLEAIRMGAVDALVVKGTQKQQVFTLKSADYTYRMLIESMNQGALAVDYDGVILYSNKQFSAMLGLPLEQIIGARVQSFVDPSDRPLMMDFMKNNVKNNVKTELRLQAAKKASIGVLLSATKLPPDEAIAYQCIVVTDMTERNQAEEAKDEFISLASHQLRTPATAVKQYINMVLDGFFGRLNRHQADALQKANASNERELSIVNDLLRVAQIDAGKDIGIKKKADLPAMLKSVVAELSVRAKARRQTIKCKLPKKPVEAFVHADLLRMAVENILDNACKYSPEAKRINVMLQVRDNNAVIAIEDEGVGMSKEDISKLYLKFSRLPNELSVKAGGSGLGLYWVKKVIDLHAGKIEVASEVNKGTVFKIILPLHDSHKKDSSS